MISGRIMLDGKRKIAIWNILDWRDPDIVMEKSLALLSSGWDQVWVFAPGICKELELKRQNVRVVAFDRNVNRDNAEGTFAELLRERLLPPQETGPKRVLPRPPTLEHVTIKPLDPDVDSGWGQSIKEFLARLEVTFDSQRRFPLSMGRAHYYTVDFFVGKCGEAIEPHRDDQIDDRTQTRMLSQQRLSFSPCLVLL